MSNARCWVLLLTGLALLVLLNGGNSGEPPAPRVAASAESDQAGFTVAAPPASGGVAAPAP